MLKVTILKPDLKEIKGTSAAGKPYHLRIQTAYASTIDDDGVVSEIPEKFEVLLDADQAAYPRGIYSLQPSSLTVDRDGRLAVRPRFSPIPVTAAKA